MRFCSRIVIAGIAWIVSHATHAQVASPNICKRPDAGSLVEDPPELRSHNGVLNVDLTVRNEALRDGSVRYCYLQDDGSASPTLRVRPGDLLIVRLRNQLSELQAIGTAPVHKTHSVLHSRPGADPCTSAMMSSLSTNLHFHGLKVPPVCHADEVLKTSIQPGDPVFEYRFTIPANEAPGLYWYHPHIHGFTAQQVQGGASGALIVEGIEQRYPKAAGLPERLLVIRDQPLLEPEAAPLDESNLKSLVDPEGDVLNTRTGTGKPAKDLSVNFVPVPFPIYPPASIKMKPGLHELWRVLNASSVTYLNLVVIFKPGTSFVPQTVTVVGIDGVPLDATLDPLHPVKRTQNLLLAPGARVEFIVNAPAAGIPGMLATRAVNTGTTGENDPSRILASIITTPDAPAQLSILPTFTSPRDADAPWVGNVTPVRVRRLYFSEDPLDSSKLNPHQQFYITVDGQKPAAFDSMSGKPNIVVKQGDVEDWIIENRTPELHAFHIHQIHFRLLESAGLPVNERFLRDTVNVPFYSDGMKSYPNVRLRMDFRDPDVVGTFLYHCHLLDHGDAGMMGMIRVEPAAR